MYLFLHSSIYGLLSFLVTLHPTNASNGVLPNQYFVPITTTLTTFLLMLLQFLSHDTNYSPCLKKKKNRKWKVKESAPSFKNKPKVLVILFTGTCQAYFLVPTYKNLNFLNCFTIRLQTRHRYLNQQRDESSH